MSKVFKVQNVDRIPSDHELKPMTIYVSCKDESVVYICPISGKINRIRYNSFTNYGTNEDWCVMIVNGYVNINRITVPELSTDPMDYRINKNVLIRN